MWTLLLIFINPVADKNRVISIQVSDPNAKKIRTFFGKTRSQNASMTPNQYFPCNILNNVSNIKILFEID